MTIVLASRRHLSGDGCPIWPRRERSTRLGNTLIDVWLAYIYAVSRSSMQEEQVHHRLRILLRITLICTKQPSHSSDKSFPSMSTDPLGVRWIARPKPKSRQAISI
jgi:hypothetical protein